MPYTDDIEPLEDLDSLAERYVRACAEVDETRRRRLREDFLRRALPFARRLAGRYCGRGEPREDLEQVARLGLVKAVNRYDPQRGSFTAYAVTTVTGEIKRHFRTTWGVHVPRRMQELSLETTHATTVLTARLARCPTPEELAGEMGIDVEDVLAAQMSSAGHKPLSLNAATDVSGTETGDMFGATDPRFGLVDDWLTVQRLLCHLPERERRILTLRFYGNFSQSEIADELGISQMHVSRLLTRALAWLRAAMLSDGPAVWTDRNDADHRIKLAVVRRKGILRVCLSGVLDRDNADRLREDLLDTIRCCDGLPRLVIDVAGVPLFGAIGVAVLLRVRQAARARSIDLHVVGLRPGSAHILAASGVRGVLEREPITARQSRRTPAGTRSRVDA